METDRFASGPLASSEVCIIDSANKIRTAIPVSTLNQKPDEKSIHTINAELSILKD